MQKVLDVMLVAAMLATAIPALPETPPAVSGDVATADTQTETDTDESSDDDLRVAL